MYSDLIDQELIPEVLNFAATFWRGLSVGIEMIKNIAAWEVSPLSRFSNNTV
jgi:hypothetical protein